MFSPDVLLESYPKNVQDSKIYLFWTIPKGVAKPSFLTLQSGDAQKTMFF